MAGDVAAATDKKEIHCYCSRKPMLAMYGVDEDGLLYIHIKIYKQNRIFGEFIIRGGNVQMRCRECFRWYRIFIQDNSPVLRQQNQPAELQNDQHFVMEFSNDDG